MRDQGGLESVQEARDVQTQPSNDKNDFPENGKFKPKLEARGWRLVAGDCRLKARGKRLEAMC